MFWTKRKKSDDPFRKRAESASIFQATFESEVRANQDRLKDDAHRLQSIVEQVAREIGEPPIAYNDAGESYIHPKLAAELAKPQNEELLRLLRDAFRNS